MIIDNDFDNFRHSQWRAEDGQLPLPGLPHWAIIDMGAPETIAKIDT
jgi:hypothetical protein